MKKVLALSLVLLLLITSTPFTSFAISDAGITMETISSDYATAILLDRTTGSTVGLSLSPAIGSASLNGNTVEMSSLAPNTAYTLTVNETVTTSAPKEYSLERRWISTGFFSGYHYYFYKDDQMIEHEANLSNVYYYDWQHNQTVAQNVDFGWYIVNYFIMGTSSTSTPSTGSINFTTLPSLIINIVGNGTVTPSRPAPYAKDSTVTLTAIPSENSHFVSWSDVSSTALTHDVVMSGNQTITATFAINQYDVTFINNSETVLTTPVNHGSLVSSQAVSPRDGFIFDGWYNGEQKFDFNTPITAPLTLTAKWLPVNMYFTVDNGLEVYHNGTLLSPVFTPSGGSYPWQLVKSYYADLQTGDIIAVKGVDEGVVAGFIGEIRINGVAYPTQQNSFWRQSEVEQTGWNTKNFNMNETWGPVSDKTYASWDNKLIGTPTGFNATWVWSANNDFTQTQNHVVYFRYVVGGYPTVTFNSNGGTEFDPITVPAGTSLTGNSKILPIPTKAGFTFTKWVLVETTTEFNGATIINNDLQVVAQYTPIVPDTTSTPGTTEAPVQPSEPATEAPTSPATTQPTTEVITDEDVAEGGAIISNFDSFIDETATEATTEAVEEVEIDTEATPLADALPQTGQLPVELFYGVGGLITAAGVFLKKKN